ncbi:hypothetical protein ACR6C2_40245 [Streptomyces sp. INA 01156]
MGAGQGRRGGGGDPLEHVEISGGRLVVDDTDIYSYNDCDTDADETYTFTYEITNKGTGPPTTPSSSTPSTTTETSSARPTSVRPI